MGTMREAVVQFPVKRMATIRANMNHYQYVVSQANKKPRQDILLAGSGDDFSPASTTSPGAREDYCLSPSSSVLAAGLSLSFAGANRRNVAAKSASFARMLLFMTLRSNFKASLLG